MSEKDIANFVFELAQLRRIKHEGWRLAGVEHPESVADHALRAAQIVFILAKLEKYEKPEEVCTMLVFHDIGETRIGDIHRVSKRYVKSDEERAVKDQTAKLGEIGKDIQNLWSRANERNTTAGIIAKDADFLEQAFTAKEYMERGYKFSEDWIINVEKALKTKSAKSLLKELKKTNSNEWWKGLKKLE